MIPNGLPSRSPGRCWNAPGGGRNAFLVLTQHQWCAFQKLCAAPHEP
jgi:hypothetical protein